MKEEEKKDKLAQFIHENRDDFDNFTFDETPIWEAIEQQLTKQSVSFARKKSKTITLHYTTFWGMAASISLLLVTIMVFWLYQKPMQQEVSIAQNQQQFLEKIAPDLALAEVYYTKQISEKSKEIEQYYAKKMLTDKTFMKDIQQLDSMYVKLKEDLFRTEGKEQVVGAMIKNLQFRIEILNKQLAILQKIEQLKQEKEHGKTNL